MKIPFSPPDIREEEINEVVDCLRSGWITTGPKTKKFEEMISEYCGTKKTVALSSSTAAMEMSLRVLGIGPGDEVILPSYTYTATCSVVCHVGAKPVMVDIQKDSFEMDYEKLENAITENTKAIISVDLAGIICDYEKIFEIVEKNKSKFKPNTELQQKFGRVIVIADCSHAFGAVRNGKKAGNIADFSCYSFHAVKNLTTAEGGAVTWRENDKINSEDLYKKYQILSLHGQTKDALAKTQLGSWEYDIIEPAYKCNMTDIQAGIGIAQLKRYDKLLKRRHEIIEKYNNAFKNKKIKVLNHFSTNAISSGHLYMTRIDGITPEQRNEIIIKMAEKGIATNVHYKPLPMLTAYKNLGFKIEDFPNAYEFFANEITLPLYSLLTDEQVDYIIENYIQILGEYGV